MDKKLIYVIVAIIVLGIGGFFVLGNKSSKPPSTPTQTAVQPSTTPTNQQSLKDLLTGGGAKKCTFEYKEANSKGSVYIANSKMRGDFQAPTNGQTINSHMIVDGTNAYIWMDNQTQGFKMSWDSVANQPTQSRDQNSIDINKKVNYKCDSWSVDNSQFSLPKGIEFKDLSAMMPKATGISPSK